MIPELKIAIILLCGLLYSCMDDVTNPAITADHSNYFPLIKGSYYKYDVVQTDSSGVVTNSNRLVSFGNDTVIDRTPYVIQIDSVLNGSTYQITNSLLRKSGSGIFYFADTTGLIGFFPDSLQSGVNLQTELRTQLFPLLAGSAWTVYRVSLKINDFLSFNIAEITAGFNSDEEITLNISGIQQTFLTKKVEYTYKLRLDTSGDPFVFNSTVWLAENIGIVKMEGSAVLLSIFGGGLLISTDTFLTSTQTLVDFHIN